MKKILLILVSISLLISCTKEFEINKQNVESTYKIEDRSLNLANNEIKYFVNLNKYMTGTEVNNIYLQNNQIQKLNISDFDKLGRLDISNNEVRFINDLSLPKNIRHLSVAWNSLDNLNGLEQYINLKTLDLSHNNLEDEDIDLWMFERLKFVNIDGNNVSIELINKVNEFNALYLSQNKKPFSE